jgi:hypothetical protein
LQQLLGPTSATSIAALFLHLPGTAESKPGSPLGLLGGVATGDQITCMLVEMEAQLFFELLFQAASAP